MTNIIWTNERRKLKDLKPWERNPRQITKDQAKRLVESFDEFGQVETIAIGPNNEVYNGHQRLNVLKDKYGEDYEVEVRVSSRELTEKQREKLTVYLHKGAAGVWDFDTLANEFELDDLLEWGFDKKELDIDLWAEDAPEDVEPQIDKAEELRVKWGVETGQLWQLGKHRLICGDCTDKAVVERLLGDDKPSLMVTDPPYGVEYESEKGVVTNDDRFDWSDAYNLFSGDVAYVWHGERTSLDVGINLRSCGFEIRSRIVWVKPSLTMGRGHYHFQHEGAWYAVKTGAVSHWCGDHKQSTVWNIDRENHQHPTVKPIECMERPIKNHESEFVYDPFLGSGTTLIACERLGRKCRAVEISPAYCAVAIQRWVDVTGGTPELVEPVMQVEAD